MTSQEKNKFICENFDPPICWHEGKKIIHEDCAPYWICSCGYKSYSLVRFEEHIKASNPDFTSKAGRVQLLELTVNYKYWNKWHIDYMALKNFMLNNTGLFRDTVFRWMGGEG